MKLDLQKYIVNRTPIQNVYKNGRDKDVETVISMNGAINHCPILALAFFIAEDIGFTPEIIDLILRLNRYCKYTEVLNQPEHSPFLNNLQMRDIKK